MSSPTSCCPACGETNTVNVPGSAGVSAFTTTTANFTIPAVDATVVISVGTTAWMAVGEKVFASDGVDWGTFEVQSIGSSTQFTGVFMGYTDDASPGAVVGSGATVTPSGVQQEFSTTSLKALNTTLLTGINALTDNTTGTASDTLAAGVGKYSLIIPLTSLATGLSTLAIDLLTTNPIGHAFKLLSFDFVPTIVGAGAGASQNFNLEIGTTNVTGGVLNPTLANTATIGAIVSGSAITANNVGTAADTISIEMAAGGTVFTSGSGYFVIRLQNMDTASAVASLADKLNDILAALQT